MPITRPEAPGDGHDILARHLGTVLEGPAAHRHGAPASLEHLRIAHPHRAFHYGLDDLLAGAGLDRAQDVGWEYVLLDGETPLGIAFLGYGPDGALRFEGITSGPIVDATLDALRFAEEHEHVSRNHLELRLLAIPALPFHALWLHGADDRFVPLHDAPGIPRAQLHTWPAIEATLRERAREVRAHDDDGPR